MEMVPTIPNQLLLPLLLVVVVLLEDRTVTTKTSIMMVGSWITRKRIKLLDVFLFLSRIIKHYEYSIE